MSAKKFIILIDDQERNTILAALRFYQDEGQGEPSNRSDAIHDIATNNDQQISMDEEGIDALCQHINMRDKKIETFLRQVARFTKDVDDDGDILEGHGVPSSEEMCGTLNSVIDDARAIVKELDNG